MATSRKDVQTVTAKMIHRILKNPNPGAQKAALANLRRGIGHTPGEIPQLWGEFLLDLPEAMQGWDGEPSRAEWAIYTALTLFALHQQGYDPGNEPMHREGNRFGTSVGRLATDEDKMKRILRRLNAAATAGSMPALAHYLRGLVLLLRTEGIAVDYAALAGDVYRYQFPEDTAQVRLAWGQDFYACYNNNKSGEDKKV